MSRQRSYRPAAFTLVELLLVVAVLIIAAAIVLPNIGSAGDAQAKSAATVLTSDLELARDLALKTQCPHTVLFSSDEQSYKVVADYAGEAYAAAQAVEHPVVEGTLFEGTLAERNGMGGVSVTDVSFGGDACVTFNELGEPSAAGSVTVQAGRTQMRIAVTGLTGSVSTTRVSD